MRRLDSPFSTSWNKWWVCIFLAIMWGLTVQGFLTGNQKVTPFLYIVPPITVVIVWWLLGFKRVALDADTLIVFGHGRETRVSVSHIEKIAEHRLGRGLEHVTVVFKSTTEIGRRVRIFVGSKDEVDSTAKLLRRAMEGKNVGVKINHTPHGSRSVSEAASQKEVIVKGWTGDELSAILADFANKYDDQLNPDFDFNVQPGSNGSTRITFPHDIPPLLFSFLINYLQYPKNHDSNGRTTSVLGMALISKDFNPPEKELIGRKANFYVPSNDQDYDVVYVRVGQETFANSFASRHWKKVVDSRIPPGIDAV